MQDTDVDTEYADSRYHAMQQLHTAIAGVYVCN